VRSVRNFSGKCKNYEIHIQVHCDVKQRGSLNVGVATLRNVCINGRGATPKNTSTFTDDAVRTSNLTKHFSHIRSVVLN